MNTYGTKFRVTTYGESHGLAVGGVIDGCPSGVLLDFDAIEHDMVRRREGAPRQEDDKIEWLSGIKDGVTLGTPILFTVANNNIQSNDYDQLEHYFRPGHADYTYQTRYGIRDHRGGGRASARETVSRVVAGAIAKQLLGDIVIHADVAKVGPEYENDTYGGIVKCRIDNLKAGIGEPVFGKLNAQLAAAMMSIPSAIGFEMGAGFPAAQMRGSEFVDQWKEGGGTMTNNCGGIQGGISNGMPIEFRVAFHPIVTLSRPTQCMSTDGTIAEIEMRGRHDRCQVYRATVIVEAMAALCLVNHLL